MNRHRTRRVVALALLFLSTTAAHADLIAYNVTLDTSLLAANKSSQGPFAVDFQLSDGSSGDGVNNNTATVSGFALTGGALTGSGNPTGSVSGDLSSGLTLSDNGLLNDFNQAFTPGSSLSFVLDLTTNVSPSEQTTPDEFAFTVYSNNFTSLASLAVIDISGPTPAVSSSGGSLGNGVLVPEPNVQPSVVTPEPASLTLFAVGVAALAAGRGWRRRQSHRRRPWPAQP